MTRVGRWTSQSGRYYDWDGIVAELWKTPGQWRRMLPDVPAKVAKHVRLRRSPALRLDDARVEAEARFVYVDREGHKRGDIYLRLVVVSPHHTVKEDSHGGSVP